MKRNHIKYSFASVIPPTHKKKEIIIQQTERKCHKNTLIRGSSLCGGCRGNVPAVQDRPRRSSQNATLKTHRKTMPTGYYY